MYKRKSSAHKDLRIKSIMESIKECNIEVEKYTRILLVTVDRDTPCTFLIVSLTNYRLNQFYPILKTQADISILILYRLRN